MNVGVKVDISGVLKDARAFANLPRDVEAVMTRAADDAALREVATHRYQNRTRRLERSTLSSGVFYDGPDVRKVILLMGMPYASFVQARGFTSVAIHAERAGKAMSAGFEKLGRSIG